MDVINVVKHFHNTAIWYVIKEHILERDPKSVINVVKHLQDKMCLKSHLRTHAGEKHLHIPALSQVIK